MENEKREVEAAPQGNDDDDDDFLAVATTVNMDMLDSKTEESAEESDEDDDDDDKVEELEKSFGEILDLREELESKRSRKSYLLPESLSFRSARIRDSIVERIRNARENLRQASSYASFELPSGIRPQNKPWYKPGKAVACYLIMVICGLMMFIEIGVNDWEFESMATNPTLGPSVNTLLLLGAKRTDLILDGDWYRLFTPIFLHGGVIHYLLNMVFLRMIGAPLEEQFGILAIGYIFLLSGFMGVLVSSIFSPTTVSVGASGGLFGLFGSAWAELVQNWSLYGDNGWNSLRWLSFSTTINLVFGLMPFLDNFAHLGGFFTGVVCGMGVLVSDRYTRHGEQKEKKTYQRNLQILSVVLTPIMIIVGLLLLYLVVGSGRNLDDWCPWCKYLSCVPFPPGDDPWWTCDPCSDAGPKAVSDSATGNTTITCPGGTLCVIKTPQDFSEETFLGYCQMYCTGNYADCLT